MLNAIARKERSPSSSPVDAFLERLEELSPDQWLRVGAAAVRSGTRTGPAAILLDVFSAHSALCLDAWTASDAVETVGWALFGGRHAARWSRAEHELLRIALDAARLAAAVLCAREWVTDADFASVYRPFAAVIPPAILGVMALETSPISHS